DLGVNCLWLLPILESPMRDAGFDISDYRMIRHDLLGLPQDAPAEQRIGVFSDFLENAHRRGIRVIFDIAINHTSEEHPWFREALKGPGNPFRDYYIWSKDTGLYKEARIIFEGLCTSNWEKSGDGYYFHRFFEFQPDLNYKNPEVLVEMCRNFLFWLRVGVDGFRADAIPYLWKEDDTSCENLPQTHTIVKFFRAVIDRVRPGTLLLAEACQKPHEVVKYFGSGDECNAGYHFPLMPQVFKSLAAGETSHIKKVLSKKVTPEIPAGSQWFTFLRCHDELSLELVYVTEEDRKYIHDRYCRIPDWDFRMGQGISARLAELLDRNPDKIALAFSVMLTLPGTPVIYYGDEYARMNDTDYYREMVRLTGKDDTRFLVRGRMDWEQIAREIDNNGSLAHLTYNRLKKMIALRKQFKSFGLGSIQWLKVWVLSRGCKDSVMAFTRKYRNEKLLLIHNFSDSEQPVYFESIENLPSEDLFGQKISRCTNWEFLRLPPYSYFWIKMN
ncbi:MAG: alpha-glucosidase C-terminal domain-containing protein, partial [Bacteroidales bacterium]|nr:alpha-glucosidase C-terminal domain-containing protein [Bacteroidales bacterium]